MEDYRMSQDAPWYRWRPKPVGAVAGIFVIAGFALAGVSYWFLLLVAVGTVGPGYLRELGWLRDQDEFQRRAAHRAGYHAFLVTVFVAFLALAYTRSGVRNLREPEELSTFFLALMWFTWLWSSLVNYWGARRTAFRILVIFGSVVGVFNILGDLKDPLGMLMQLLVTTLPFFLFAYLSRRWPRVAGAFMVVTAGVAVGYYFTHFENLDLITKACTVVLVAGPLAASGVALLGWSQEGVEQPGA
jgi:MFS family permease